MNQRCANPNVTDHEHYIDRGIAVCKRWRKFENFFADMGARPSDKHSLDRIDNDSGYFKSNCRWATRREQRRNQRRYTGENK